MALRLFRCRGCGHRMRFSGDRCNACYAEKSQWQWPGTTLGLALLGIAFLVGSALLA